MFHASVCVTTRCYRGGDQTWAVQQVSGYTCRLTNVVVTAAMTHN
jgi:hypothetical protein